MPTNRKHRLRKRKPGGAATAALIEVLAETCALSITVELEQRAGTQPFSAMTEEEATAELRRLWKLRAGNL